MDWDWYVIIAIIILGLWAFIATGRAVRLSNKIAKSHACLHIFERENEDGPGLYLDAYEDPSEWKDEKFIVVDIKYYKEKV